MDETDSKLSFGYIKFDEVLIEIISLLHLESTSFVESIDRGPCVLLIMNFWKNHGQIGLLLRIRKHNNIAWLRILLHLL